MVTDILFVWPSPECLYLHVPVFYFDHHFFFKLLSTTIEDARKTSTESCHQVFLSVSIASGKKIVARFLQDPMLRIFLISCTSKFLKSPPAIYNLCQELSRLSVKLKKKRVAFIDSVWSFYNAGRECWISIIATLWLLTVQRLLTNHFQSPQRDGLMMFIQNWWRVPVQQKWLMERMLGLYGLVHVCMDSFGLFGPANICMDLLVLYGLVYVCMELLILYGLVHVCIDMLDLCLYGFVEFV